jgi:hypothetical protein
MTNYALDRLVGFRALAALLLAVLAFVPVQGALAADDPADQAFWYSTGADGSPRIKVYFYWTTRCEHCRAARPFLEDLPNRLPFVDLVSRPTDGSATNARSQYATARALGADPVAVPAIFFCGEAQIGYDSASGVGADLVRRLEACRSRLAADPALLTKPVAVVPEDQRATSGSGGSGAAIVIGALFVAMILAGIVLSRKSATAKERAIAAKKGDKPKRRKR